MTTVFENRYTVVAEFLGELEKDAQHDKITDKIIRLSLRRGPATYRMLNPNHMMARADQPLGWWFVARFLEASYTARGQLQKLSAYGGLGFNKITFLAAAGTRPEGPKLAEQYDLLNTETDKRLAEMTYRVQQEAAKHDLELRGGATFVEEGAWVADPFSPIEPVPQPTCATCGESIYEANDRWRHKASLTVGAGPEPYFVVKAGQAEAYIPEPCPGCAGTGEMPRGRTFTRCQRCLGMKVVQKLHHLADPVQAGRLV